VGRIGEEVDLIHAVVASAALARPIRWDSSYLIGGEI
jgi:hypothetical protein